MLKCQEQYNIPLGTRRYCSVESTSLALIQRRNKVVCQWGCPQGLFSGVQILPKGFTSPVRNPTSPYRLLLYICKENPLAHTIFQLVSLLLPG